MPAPLLPIPILFSQKLKLLARGQKAGPKTRIDHLHTFAEARKAHSRL